MDNWSHWKDIEEANQLDNYGIYQIRVVNRNGEAIPICRFAGIDQEGLIYVGRSGYHSAKTVRTIAVRIEEFVKQRHSGGITYARALEVLNSQTKFFGHKLQVKAKFLPDEQIDETETNVLNDYFSSYAELPPCNSRR